MKLLLALGGNAILRKGQRGTYGQQERSIARTAGRIAGIAGMGYDIVLTYGNGPQVGDILLRNELARKRIPAMPLHVCGGESQGMLGYMLAQSLANSLRTRHIGKEVACVLTQTVVDRSDPGFRNPSKSIGPFYSAGAARRLAREYGWRMVKEHGMRRRVVASPLPVSIVELDTIRNLLSLGKVVVCAGGGGVPVVRRGRMLNGVDAVVDKDLTSSLLAVQLKVDRLVMLTDVSNVFLNYGKRGQQRLSKLTARECELYMDEGQFEQGTMKPKIEAALQYVSATGRDAVIASLDRVEAAVLGNAGTRITANNR